MEIGKALELVAKKHLKPVIKPLALDLVNEVVFAILEEKVKETGTPIDDAILVAVKDAVLKAIEKLEV